MASLLIDQPQESVHELLISQHASPYLPFEPIPFEDDDDLDDEYHGPVFYQEKDGQGAFDFVQQMMIDPNNMYANATGDAILNSLPRGGRYRNSHRPALESGELTPDKLIETLKIAAPHFLEKAEAPTYDWSDMKKGQHKEHGPKTRDEFELHERLKMLIRGNQKTV